MIFRSRKRRGGAAVAEREAAAEQGPSLDELFAEIAALSAENREERDLGRERRIIRLRHRAGARLGAEARGDPEHPAPAFNLLPTGSALPEVAPERLTPELVRAGVLRNGCLLVRGLIEPEQASRLRDEIDLAFQARDSRQANGADEDGYWEQFEPDPPFRLDQRNWVEGGGGIWAADSPKVMFQVLETFERAGLRNLVGDYLGEPPAISVNKCVLRKVTPEGGGAWHQDGAFMGDVCALNVWLSLSRCGDEAPGLDIVPRRLNGVVPAGTEGAIFDWSVSPAVAEEAAGEVGIQRPIFEPGDMLLFDELFLHSTALEPGMKNTRYAVESWFFGPSGFPGDYVPLAF